MAVIMIAEEGSKGGDVNHVNDGYGDDDGDGDSRNIIVIYLRDILLFQEEAGVCK
jgi:hypothetical protein